MAYEVILDNRIATIQPIFFKSSSELALWAYPWAGMLKNTAERRAR